MTYPRRSGRRWPKIVLVIAAVVLVVALWSRGSSSAPQRPQSQATSSMTVSAVTTPAAAASPTSSNQVADLMSTACSFTSAYWSSSPTDSPLAIKQRAAAYVLDPATFNWQSSFGVTIDTVSAVCVREYTIAHVDDDDPTLYEASIMVQKTTTDGNTGAVYPPDRGSRSWIVYFRQVGGAWKAVAEEDRSIVPSPTQHPS